MACLNTFDLIAYPGTRRVVMFQAASGASFRSQLQAILASAGWSVIAADVSGGPNPGTGFKCTSRAAPWCPSGPAPEDYVGKVRVWFYPRPTFTPAFQSQTEFLVMNEAETMVQSSSEIQLKTTTDDYAPFSYMVCATPYDFKIFMLGVARRDADGISNSQTAVLCGVPQIPNFLQGRPGWCQYGVNEMFYIAQADSMRSGYMYSPPGQFWAGGISSKLSDMDPEVTFMNTNTVSSEGWRNGIRLSYGTGWQNSPSSNMWVFDQDHPAPDDWNPLMWPPCIAWPSDPAHVDATDRLKGFIWDSMVVNKELPADTLLEFDDHQFIVFTHNGVGGLAPYRPPGGLILTIEGAV